MARERRSREAAGSTPGILASRASGRKRPRHRRTTTFTRTRSTTRSNRPLPVSTAPRLLDGEGRGALDRARTLSIDDLLELIEKSNLRGRGGAGYPFVDKVRAVRRND